MQPPLASARFLSDLMESLFFCETWFECVCGSLRKFCLAVACEASSVRKGNLYYCHNEY